ncbi:hypothetical protein [Runella slithyformis]|uniref:Glycosyltransferase RgtA/B/C/D-like domain-containing protein n=1 Tax=Runella slithyformis (strain ATCC 29530 / DSM 19594 / LMG 11500 / NCIMB 11436 / LSU 4) TaxID=761193 RepID=A0A7U4E5Y1_RUNSL|nr:hypothetical protein [Runella slithyformis]AEI48629.1 hypothetical protein Runsl_2217 [Runella slithyformis DSM 19594]
MPLFRSFFALRFLAIGLISVAVCTYYQRYPTDDDAWFAEESYWLLQDGKVRSEFFRGLLGWEKHYLVNHKLFIAVGALLLSVFPDSVYGAKLPGLLFFILLLSVMIYEVKRRRYSPINEPLLLLLILLFGHALMVKMSFENRPEMMLIAFGFCSFCIIRSARLRWQTVALGGSLAGLAALSHLNGIIFILAGFMTLLLTQPYRYALLFALFAGLTGSFYFYDVLTVPNGFETWWFQFRNDPATQNAFGWQAKLAVMLSFPTIFVESPEQLSLTVLLIGVLWFKRKQLSYLDKTLVIYSLSLLFSFWFITKRASGIYQVLFIPFMILLILETVYKKPEKSIPAYLKMVFFLYVLVGVAGNAMVIHSNRREYLPNTYAELRKNIPAHTAGVVPLTFFFNEYKHYPTLLCYTNFDLQMLQRKPATVPDSHSFFQWAAANHAHLFCLIMTSTALFIFPKKERNALIPINWIFLTDALRFMFWQTVEFNL